MGCTTISVGSMDLCSLTAEHVRWLHFNKVVFVLTDVCHHSSKSSWDRDVDKLHGMYHVTENNRRDLFPNAASKAESSPGCCISLLGFKGATA